MLLPGGSAPLVGPGGYAEVGQIFFDLAKNVNWSNNKMELLQSQAPVDRELSGSSASARHIGH